MVRNSFLNIFLTFLLFHCAYGDEDKVEIKNDEKSVAKRGILHLNIHGHHLHTPTPHLHAATPHFHVATAPHYHFNSPHVHHLPIVPKIPVIQRPVIPPYHIHHGGATVTSFNVNYPKYPFVHKAIVPAVFPGFHHHNHHAFVPHTHHHGILPHSHTVPHTHSILPQHHHHIAKPLIPIAVPYPGIRVQKYPVFVHSKPQFVPSFEHPFIPIPIPTEAATPVQINPGRITNFMLTRPTQNKFPSPPNNYHAHRHFNGDIDNIQYRKMMKNFQVSGGQHLAQYLDLHHHHHHQSHQSQQLVQEPQNSYGVPYSAAETFAQNYDQPSNHGNYHGLSSYQVPIGAIQK